MTEEEAQQKWCPMINFQIGPVNSSQWQGIAYNNRGQEYEPGTCRCIGSDCMAWREECFIEWDDRENKSLEFCKGYCGLAGKP